MKYFGVLLILAIIVIPILFFVVSCESGGCNDFTGLYENHDKGLWFSLTEDTFEILSEKEPGKVITIESGKLVKLTGCEFKYIQDSDNSSKTFTIRGKKLIQIDETTDAEIFYVKVRDVRD